MTIAAIAAQLLTHFSPEERTVPDAVAFPGRNAAVAMAMNGALQELFGKGGPWVRYDERGQLLNAPTAVTIAVTNGSTSATITGWAAWMAGCSIVIDGGEFDNQIRNDSASATLKLPFDGTSGTKNAVVYHDSLTLGAEVMEVCAPVKINGRPVFPMPSGEYPFETRGEEDFGFHRRMSEPPEPTRVSERLGDPVAYAVETWSKNATTAAEPRMRIQPAPDVAGRVEYRAMLAPPIVISDLAATDVLPIPLQFVQTLFYPLARQRLKACPFYRQGPGEEEAARAYQDALAMLKEMNPRKESGSQFRSIY